MLKKITVEAALNAEMDEHLSYEKYAKLVVKNNRNGITNKRIKTEDGEFVLDTPRDRYGSFEPKLVKRINLDLRLWMRKSCDYMLKA